MTVYPSGMVLADTSAYHVARGLPEIREYLESLARRYLLATCSPVDLELGQSAQSLSNHRATFAERAQLLIDLPLTERVTARAREVQELLAGRGQHRGVGPADLLIAAAAEIHGAIVLHYDRDYDRIARCTGQPVEWAAPPGTGHPPPDGQ